MAIDIIVNNNNINICLLIAQTSYLYFRKAMTAIALNYRMLDLDASFCISFITNIGMCIACVIINVINANLQLLLALYGYAFTCYFISQFRACKFNFPEAIYISKFTS